jgi:hypothetical protein
MNRPPKYTATMSTYILHLRHTALAFLRTELHIWVKRRKEGGRRTPATKGASNRFVYYITVVTDSRVTINEGVFMSMPLWIRWWMRKYYKSSCYTFYALVDLLFRATDALHVTVHFACPRGILVVAQPSNLQTLHFAHHGWSHLLLHCATETTTVSIAIRIKRHRHVISHICETIL